VVLISLSQAIEPACGYTTESVTHGRYQFILLGEQRHIVCEQLAQSEAERPDL